MTKIIRQDFSLAQFNRIVEEFIYSDVRITIPYEDLPKLKGYITKMGPKFQKIFQAYFARQDNKRYDNLVRFMAAFLKEIAHCPDELQGNLRKGYFIFWNEIGDIIRKDYEEIMDSYLANSCNYFIHEIEQLS